MPLPKDQFSFFTSTKLTMTSAALITPPASMEDARRANSAGTRFGLPALPTIGVKILETDGKPSPTRQSLRGVLQEIVDELLSNRRSD
jgi:hypothetical protein